MKGWESTRLALRKRFQKAGIDYCELHYAGCWVNNNLSFAHSMKRRKIRTQEELEEVIVACVPCHQILEVKPPEEMLRIVRETIKEREGISSMFD